MTTEIPFDVLLLAKGDKRVFKVVYDGFFQNICLFVNRFVHDLDVSQDIAQEVFVTLWKHKEEMDSPAHVQSFLYVSAHHAALDYLKHEKVRDKYYDSMLSEYESSETFMHFVIEEEVDRILLKTEEDLPPKCKEIFILSMQDKSNEEIAAELGISVNTVKTQKKIAYRVLKYHISELSSLFLWLTIECNKL